MEIYHLGIRLDELKGHLDHVQWGPEPEGPDSALDGSPALHFPRPPAHPPAPSGQAPTAAFQAPCPEVPLAQPHWALLHSLP